MISLFRWASAPLLALALASPDGDDLRVVYSAGEVVSLEQREWSSTEPSEVSMTINGEEVPEDALEQMGAGMPSERKDELHRTTTWLDAVEEGRPTRARRLFDELTLTKVEGEEESETSGVLEGRTLELTAEDDVVEARLAEGDDGEPVEDAYLENHRLTVDVERYLKEGAVDVGDTWDLDEGVVRELLGITRDGPRLFEDDEEDDGDELDEIAERHAEVSGTVAYEGREEVDGVTCAVLLVTMTLELPETDVDPAVLGMEPEEGFEASATLALEMSGTDRVWLAIEEGRPVRSEGEMGGSIRARFEMTNADLGAEIVVVVAADVEGGSENSWSYDEE